MYSVISEILEVLSTLVQGYCLQYFFGSFLESRLSGSKSSKYGRSISGSSKRWQNALLGMVLYSALKLGMNFVLISDYSSIKILEKQILTFFSLLIVAVCLYKAVHAITFFLVVTFMAVSEICFFLAYMVFQMSNHLFEFWSWCFISGYITSVDTFDKVINMTVVVLQLLLYVIFNAFLFASLKKIVKSFREKDYTIHKTELYFILTPGMVGLLICVLLRIIMITVENDISVLIYDKYPVLIGIIPAILILSLLSILYGVKLFQDMIVLNREKNSRIILEQQVNNMQEHIREMEHIHSGIRSMKHDMKNTLSIIMQLAAGKEENAELQAYLSELNQSMDRLEYRFRTGNVVVDTLLNMKYHEAVRTMPELRMETERLIFSDKLLIQSYDIGVILGNALDNAIEACQRLKEKEPDADAFIRLSSFQRGRMLFIEVENSFDGILIRKHQAEFPITDKADREAHGIGLANIKNTAEKYHGAVEWSVNNKVFRLSVMMQDERRDENEC